MRIRHDISGELKRRWRRSNQFLNLH